MRSLLIIRPEPGAAQSLARAQSLGLDARSFPLFAVQPVAWDVPDPASYFGLLLTSANAVRHGGPGLDALRFMPVFAVGDATAHAAREAGFGSVVAGDGDVSRLLARIATLSPQTLLHLSGADFTPVDVPGIEIDRRTVYNAGLVPISAELLDMLGSSPVVAIHSVRAGQALATLCGDHGIDRSTIKLAAISAQVAASAGGGWQSLAIAKNPRDETVMALAALLCHEQ